MTRRCDPATFLRVLEEEITGYNNKVFVFFVTHGGTDKEADWT
eukprot:CAMPEP_0174270484 /NCGR_PEP_ID=MMETSP0439-20130205/44629_1 /TAXON_ID=0 /ORGANISM="Stereomyxa ramosa, Strain Chinc5" /LENGTH=42 /DNA_ID= /DNA_START= /DNA_END= /DNA_ORIENTATION=